MGTAQIAEGSAPLSETARSFLRRLWPGEPETLEASFAAEDIHRYYVELIPAANFERELEALATLALKNDLNRGLYNVDAATTKAFLKSPPVPLSPTLLIASEHAYHWLSHAGHRLSDASFKRTSEDHMRYAACRARTQVMWGIAQTLWKRKLKPTETDLEHLARVVEHWHIREDDRDYLYVANQEIGLSTFIIDHAREARGLPESLRKIASKLADRLRQANNATAKSRDLAKALLEILGKKVPCPIELGDAWSDRALAELSAMDAEATAAWNALLAHAVTVNPTNASRKWLDASRPLVEAVGEEHLSGHVKTWLRLVGRPGSIAREIGWSGETNNTVLSEQNILVLAGLAWTVACVTSSPPLGAIADAAQACLRTIPRHGARCESLGKSLVRALAAVETEAAAVQLVRLELRVKQPKYRKFIRKLLDGLCETRSLSRLDLEEAAVPDFGMTDGVARFDVGAGDETATAELSVVGSDKLQTTWLTTDKKGQPKSSRSVPKVVKEADPEGVEQVKQTAKEMEGLLPAQRTRLELLFRQRRTWRLDQFRERYLNHGLIGSLARRLIWYIDGVSVLHYDGALRDVEGKAITFADSSEVTVWHPCERPSEDVVAWRGRLAELEITQPFKQAHREVYLLTDAERNTGVYSNRFAAHIVKSSTLVAIGQARGWTVGLWGGESAPRIELPDWNLVAEFWAESAGNDDDNWGDYGPLYLATDQVRFYEAGERDPLPLERVPALPFSEILRDVDLFVGIASVGNDPTWQDGGPAGRYRDYWQSYSFGELGQSAKTRKTVLETLVPRLKIADRCSFTDKFLVVRGEVRTYKIHLGSGNILMEPDDQYLCIVPDRRQETAGAGGMFLPFEGDRTLSIILSKALLLANDTKITDPTILSQIGRRAMAS